MAAILIVGDGPAGLSAALFLSKNGHDVTVFGQNETAMNYAKLYNYLGIVQITGTEFQRIAKAQVSSFGTKLVDAEVSSVAKSDSGEFVVTTADDLTYRGDYLVLAAGASKPFADSLGLGENKHGGVAIDREGRTDIKGLYYVGWASRPNRTQAIISAGEGAAAALSILSEEAGKDFHDFDTPE